MLSQTSVFNFSKYSELLTFFKNSSPNHGKPLSYQQMATSLGVTSPRLISMLAKGDRLPSKNMAEATSKWLKLSPTEKRYLDLIIKREGLELKDKSTTEVNEEIKRLSLGEEVMKEIPEEDLPFFGQWYVFVIKQLIASKTFGHSIEEIYNLLRGKVSRTDIKYTLAKLVHYGLLELTPEKKYVFVQNVALKSSNDMPSEYIRLHHKDMLSRAKEAIDEQGLNDREFQATTLRMDPSKVGELKEEMRQFTRYINAKYTEDNESCLNVYQFNLNLFEHTKA